MTTLRQAQDSSPSTFTDKELGILSHFSMMNEVHRKTQPVEGTSLQRRELIIDWITQGIKDKSQIERDTWITESPQILLTFYLGNNPTKLKEFLAGPGKVMLWFMTTDYLSVVFGHLHALGYHTLTITLGYCFRDHVTQLTTLHI